MGNVQGTLKWPTTYEDDKTPLDLAHIDRAEIKMAAKNDPAWFTPIETLKPAPGEPEDTFEQTELEDGTWYFSVQIFGTNGKASAVVVESITVGAGAPNLAPGTGALALTQTPA